MIALGSSVSETVRSAMEKLWCKHSRRCRDPKIRSDASLERQQTTTSTRKDKSQTQTGCSSVSKTKRSSSAWFEKHRNKFLTTRNDTECQVTGMLTTKGAKKQVTDKLFQGFRRGTEREDPEEKTQRFHGGRLKTQHSKSFSGFRLLGKNTNHNSENKLIADCSKTFTSEEDRQMTTDYQPGRICRSSSCRVLNHHKLNERKSEHTVESITRGIDHLCEDAEDYRPEIDQLAPPRRSRSQTFGGKASEKVVVVLEGWVYQTDDTELDQFLTTTLCSTEL